MQLYVTGLLYTYVYVSFYFAMISMYAEYVYVIMKCYAVNVSSGWFIKVAWLNLRSHRDCMAYLLLSPPRQDAMPIQEPNRHATLYADMSSDSLPILIGYWLRVAWKYTRIVLEWE